MSQDADDRRAENERLREELARTKAEALEHLRTKRDFAAQLERALESIIDYDEWRARARAAEAARDRALAALSRILAAHDAEHESATARADAIALALDAERAVARG